jgi:hypothetical protein
MTRPTAVKVLAECSLALQLVTVRISILSAEPWQLRRRVGLSATFAVRDPLQASIERKELRVAGERRREREGVGQTQRGVPGSELRGAASESAIDIDHMRVDRGKKLIDLGVGAVLERPHDHLGIHGRRDQDVGPCRQVRSEQRDRLVMLRVGRIEEPDHDVSVECYSRHSPRSSSR